LSNSKAAKQLRADRVLVSWDACQTRWQWVQKVSRIEVDEACRGQNRRAIPHQCAGIYAIGDVITWPDARHTKPREGMACVEQLVTGYSHVNYNTFPASFTRNPKSPASAKAKTTQRGGVEYRKGVFPFSANGRARAIGHTEGRSKSWLTPNRPRSWRPHHRPARWRLIAEACAAIEFGASSEDIARTCHAHPTLSESLHEAALGVSGRAIHIKASCY
jgi:dihydrolipoamide dehydrogenase